MVVIVASTSCSPDVEVYLEQAQELQELIDIMFGSNRMHGFPVLYREALEGQHGLDEAMDRHHADHVEKVELGSGRFEELSSRQDEVGVVDEGGVGSAVEERGVGPLGNVTDVINDIVPVVRRHPGEGEEQRGVVLGGGGTIWEREVASGVRDDEGLAHELDEGLVVGLEHCRREHEVGVLLPQVRQGLPAHRKELEVLECDVESGDHDADVGAGTLAAPVEVEGVGGK